MHLEKSFSFFTVQDCRWCLSPPLESQNAVAKIICLQTSSRTLPRPPLCSQTSLWHAFSWNAPFSHSAFLLWDIFVRLSSCDLSMSQQSFIFQNGWQVHQSGSISHEKTPLPDGPSRGFQRGEGAIFAGRAFAWGQASTSPCGTGTEPCWKRAVPLEPGRSPAPQRGACWEGDAGHRPQLGVCRSTQHYRSPLPRRRDVPLTLMVKTGGMCVSLPAGAAVNTCRLAATNTQ